MQHGDSEVGGARAVRGLEDGPPEKRQLREFAGEGGVHRAVVLDERLGALRMGVDGGDLIHRFCPLGGGQRLP